MVVEVEVELEVSGVDGVARWGGRCSLKMDESLRL